MPFGTDEQWMLKDASRGNTTQAFTLEQVKAFILQIRIKDIERILIQKIGTDEWVSLKLFLETHQEFMLSNLDAVIKTSEEYSNSVISQLMIPPLPNMDEYKTGNKTIDTRFTVIVKEEAVSLQRQQYGFFAPDFSIEKVKIKNEKKKQSTVQNADSENEKTFKSNIKKIQLTMIGKTENIFRTYVSEISVASAVLLKKPGSDFHQLDFQVLITNPFEKVNSVKSKLTLKGRFSIDLLNPFKINFVGLDTEGVQKLEAFFENYQKQIKIFISTEENKKE